MEKAQSLMKIKPQIRIHITSKKDQQQQQLQKKMYEAFYYIKCRKFHTKKSRVLIPYFVALVGKTHPLLLFGMPDIHNSQSGRQQQIKNN